MTTTWTIEREVHFQAQARGRKELRVGPAPQGPPPDPGRVPRVSRLMALALRFEGLLQAGVVRDYAELARLGHVSRARVSQVIGAAGERHRARIRLSVPREMVAGSG